MLRLTAERLEFRGLVIVGPKVELSLPRLWAVLVVGLTILCGPPKDGHRRDVTAELPRPPAAVDGDEDGAAPEVWPFVCAARTRT